MVEIISPPNSPITLAFGQLIAVTKLGRARSPLTVTSNTGAAWNLRDFKSLCKGRDYLGNDAG